MAKKKKKKKEGGGGGGRGRASEFSNPLVASSGTMQGYLFF